MSGTGEESGRKLDEKGAENERKEESVQNLKDEHGMGNKPPVTGEPRRNGRVREAEEYARKKRVRIQEVREDVDLADERQCKVGRKKPCRRVSKVLENHGTKIWSSMEEFVDYLKEWQERNGVRLVHHDSKGAEAHNASCRRRAGDCGYISVKDSKFAYKSWACSRGKKKRSTVNSDDKHREPGSVTPRFCGFKVRARYIPSLRKVTCSVKLHDGPDALPNGHNHQLLKGKKMRAENEECVLKYLRERPEKAIAMLGSWRVEQRKRLCESVFKDAADFISNPDECSLRRMVEVLMMVNFLTPSSGKGSSKTLDQAEKEKEKIVTDGETAPGSAEKKHKRMSEDSSEYISNENGGGAVSENAQKSQPDVVSEHTSPRKSLPVRAYSVAERNIISESTSSIQSQEAREALSEGQSLCVEEVIRLVAERDVSFGDLLQKLETFPKRRNYRYVRVVDIKSLRETDFETQTLASEGVNFLLEEEKLGALLMRVERFRKGIKGTRSMKSCVSGRGLQDTAVIVEDERDLNNYIVCIEVPENIGGTDYLLSGKTLADMRKVWDLLHLLEEGKKFLEWVTCVDPENRFQLKEELAIHRSKLFVKEYLGSLPAANWQCDNGKRGFAYNLRSLVRFRGSLGRKMGEWLDSDSLEMCLLAIKAKMKARMRNFVFFMPLFQWDLCSSKRAGLRARSLKQIYGGGGGKQGRDQAEYLLELLKKQEEPIVSAEPCHLGHGVVYALVNKEQNHWLAVEACVRMKEALVYDPALSDQEKGGGDPAYYFTKLRGVLEKLLSEKNVPSPYGAEWRCLYA